MDIEVANYDLRTFNLITTLTSFLNENDNEDINVFLAKYFLDNIDKLKDKSIYDVAEECYTSRSTVQRFIKYIGFETFSNLQAKIAEASAHNDRFGRFYKQDIFRDKYLNDFENMTKSIDKICDSKTIDYFIDLIHISNNVVFNYAESSSIAPLDFQEAMLKAGKTVRIVTNSTRNTNLLNNLNESDALITLSVTGNYAIATALEVSKIKANKILITLNRNKDLFKIYDKVIYLSDDETNTDFIQDGVRNAFTIYSLSYLLDLMLNKYFEKYVK